MLQVQGHDNAHYLCPFDTTLTILHSPYYTHHTTLTILHSPQYTHYTSITMLTITHYAHYAHQATAECCKCKVFPVASTVRMEIKISRRAMIPLHGPDHEAILSQRLDP